MLPLPRAAMVRISCFSASQVPRTLASDGRILSDALSGDGRRIAFAARAVHRDVQTADTVDPDGQIVRIPRHEQHDDTEQTFHRRRSKSGGMDVPEVGRLKERESGNARLERLIAGQPLVIDSLKEFS
ncbi:hypothetical protein [Burkholderia plantarii]|uniref:hypothetical protein n=1 Tax=Burkholderia plantarii TaxID=41899 RepID=UPI0006D8CB0C|nr:hypothetical protein [Burkholderia plantarii]WLE61983.1 hypothetical protein GIY62_31725 [Burkholderia plantarii]GLZ20333.1 hypothetical protein Bpla01_38620 [Burkholderia plantarii]